MYELAAQRIEQEIAKLHSKGGDLEKTQHLSVLALAPIPLLTKLGHAMGNKFATDFFQCHRDKVDRWVWYEGEEPSEYSIIKLQSGSNVAKVALVLSLSGQVTRESLPKSVNDTFTVYEIRLANRPLNTGFLRQRDDLEKFRAAYRGLLGQIRGLHPKLNQLHLFPAVPAPVAVTCGFDLMPKVDPELVIYDNIQGEGGFVERLSVNKHER
jgi:hypothetical protein